MAVHLLAWSISLGSTFFCALGIHCFAKYMHLVSACVGAPITPQNAMQIQPQLNCCTFFILSCTALAWLGILYSCWNCAGEDNVERKWAIRTSTVRFRFAQQGYYCQSFLWLLSQRQIDEPLPRKERELTLSLTHCCWHTSPLATFPFSYQHTTQNTLPNTVHNFLFKQNISGWILAIHNFLLSK